MGSMAFRANMAVPRTMASFCTSALSISIWRLFMTCVRTRLKAVSTRPVMARGGEYRIMMIRYNMMVAACCNRGAVSWMIPCEIISLDFCLETRSPIMRLEKNSMGRERIWSKNVLSASNAAFRLMRYFAKVSVIVSTI